MDCSEHLEEMSIWLFPQKLALDYFLLLPFSKVYLALREEMLCVPEEHKRKKNLSSHLVYCTSSCCTKGSLKFE